MSSAKSLKKIHSLLNQLSFDVDRQSANKMVPKFYDLAQRIDKQLSAQEQMHKTEENNKAKNQMLDQNLKQLGQLFSKYKKTREKQIKNFNQVEYYMYQQTRNILQKHKPPIVKLVFDKITSISKIFLKQEKYKFQTDSFDINDTEGSSASDKNKFQTDKIQNRNNKNIDIKDQKIIWQNLERFYKDHRLDQAHAQGQKLKNMSLKNTLSASQVQLINTIKVQFKTMTQFYDHFYDTGYTFDKQEKGISLWYKIIGEKDVAIKVQAQIQITIQNFLCIASEIDLFQDYIPFTYETKQLKHISRNQKIGTSKIYIPLLTDRQTYFYAAAYDRLRTKGSIFFFSKTINEDLEYQERYGFKVPEKSNLVRLEYKYYILEYVPITKSRGKINMVSSIDLKMDFLPLFIINKSARIFSYDYMRNYHRINKKFKGSKWDKMKHQKHQLYDYFQQKINEYLQEKQIYE